MSENAKIQDAMNGILKLFEEGNLETVARAVFKGGDIPADKWSFLNRILMYCSGTDDARGFRQWQQVNRYVKKGSKAFYILGPMMTKKMVDVTKQDGQKVKELRDVLIGFKAIPVFRIEDTDGEPIIREAYNINIPYEFTGIIQDLGLKVSAVRFCGASYGSYNLINKTIQLASPDIEIFLHELSHAVDDRITGLRPGQRPDQEVVAEFSAAVIAQLMGYKIPLGNAKNYIEHYGMKELLSSLARVEKVINFIIERTRTAGIQQPAVLVAAEA